MMAYCSNCGSSNISFRRENVGEVRGRGTKQVVHRTVGYCKDCGYTWVAANDNVSVPRKRNTLLWVLGWLFIFPVPLTILMLRKRDITPAIKYAIIAVAWIAYFAIGSSGNSAKKADNPAPPQATVAAQKVINVELEVLPNVNSEDGSVLFEVKTNLPEDTKLLVTIYDDAEYTAQDTVVILNDGVGYTSEFSDHGESLKGHYYLVVSMSLPKLQSASVQKVIGKNGEYIGGLFVKPAELEESNVIRGEFEFDF